MTERYDELAADIKIHCGAVLGVRILEAALTLCQAWTGARLVAILEPLAKRAEGLWKGKAGADLELLIRVHGGCLKEARFNPDDDLLTAVRRTEKTA